MDVQVPELELQQSLQRFTTGFIERITQCADALQSSSHAAIRDEVLRKNLLYASSAMEIATGPSAAVNLLDMFVFVHLSRNVLETHWIPTVYGESGADLDRAFTKAEDELGNIASRAIGSAALSQLRQLVDTWLADNPGVVRVEKMRLADFAAAAGAAARDRAIQARGLLSGVKVATEAANNAMAIAERSMFLLDRLPFLWRLHVRLGVREVLDDLLARIRTGRELARLTRFAKAGASIAVLGIVTASVFLLRSRRA